MRRGSSSLLVIFGLFVLLLAGAGTYLYLFAPGVVPGTAGKALPPTPRPDVEVVEAALDLQPGTLINDTDSMLTTGKISGDDFAANPQSFFTSPEQVRNLKAVAAIHGGAPLKKDQVGAAGLSLKIPKPAPGQAPIKAFPVQVNSLTGVANQVQPGDYVDVMASFNMDIHTFRPGVPENKDNATAKDVIVDQASNEGSVKVLLQDVQVLDIVKPALPEATPQGQQAKEPPPPPAQSTAQPGQAPKNDSGSVLQPGNWVLLIGVSNQQAEVLRFALDRGIGISTLLRASGDHMTDHTVGSTMRVLIDNYGMPVPSTNQPSQLPGPVQIPNVPSLPQEKTDVFAPAVVTAGSNK